MKIRAFVALCFLLAGTSLSARDGKARISGNVRDADGNPVELVAVQVKNTVTGTMTDEKGHYSLTVATGDSVTLLFSCLGYNKAERIIPTVAGDMRVNVQMNYMSLELGQVEVTAARINTTTLETLDANRMKILPDPSGGSIESLVVTQAGVASGNELSSQYSVRGGSYDENIVYVNGMEVFRPLLIRSGEQEGLSFINPGMTESVRFSAGGFEARYGDKMSSVLDITYKKPKTFEGSASASMLGAGAYVGSSEGRFTQVTGIRYKTNRSLLGTMDTRAEYNPVFVDFQTYLTWQPAARWEINFLGNVSSNNYRFVPHDRKTSYGTAADPRSFTLYFDGKERDRFDTLYGAMTLKYSLSDKTEIGLQASAFRTREEESYDITSWYWLEDVASGESGAATEALSLAYFHEHARNRLSATVAHAGLYGLSQLSSAHILKWGALVQRERIADKISEWESRDSAGYSLPQNGREVNVIANLFSDNRLESTRLSGYVQDAFKFRTARGMFTLVGGLRASYWDYSREALFSPRLSVGFVPTANQRLVFRLATGFYYQPPFYKELRVETVDANGNHVIRLNDKLKSQRSIHFIGGGDFSFPAAGRNFKLTTELYYKRLDNVNPYTVDNVKIRYYGENCAGGYIAGVDMKLFGDFVPGTDSWLNLSLMQSRQTIRGTTRAPMPNSQLYNLSLFFQDYFPGNRHVMLNLRGVLAGGFPVTVPRQGYEAGYHRTPPYRRVDTGVTYRLAGGESALMERGLFRRFKNIWLGMDFFNLFDINNTGSYYWITDIYGEQYAVPNYLTGRQVNFRISVDF
ncbi:MAG: TonB-dependent receptor [Tannerella sp.]|nr:TonB-dependent receptor [Tannerella sp.]